MKSRGTPAPGEGVWARLKYEGGVHRVQRVPVTESQGRIHTSRGRRPRAARGRGRRGRRSTRTTCASTSTARPGPGGQSVNTTDSAVRITHVPTGIVVSCQNEKSQLQNKESAMRILRARLLAAGAGGGRRRGVRRARGRRSAPSTAPSGSAPTTIPENRISDHRVGFKAYNLDEVLDGDLDAVVQALRRRRQRRPARRREPVTRG